jgi:hypothetical protein
LLFQIGVIPFTFLIKATLAAAKTLNSYLLKRKSGY